MRYAFVTVFAIALLAGALGVACGGRGEGMATIIEVTAKDHRFNPETIEVPAGKTVTLRLKNMDETEHDLEVRGFVPSVSSGGGHGSGHVAERAMNVAVHTQARKTASVEFRADEKGSYQVFCSIAGHEQMGMVGKLVVI